MHELIEKMALGSLSFQKTPNQKNLVKKWAFKLIQESSQVNHSFNLKDTNELKHEHVEQLKRQEEWLKEKKMYEDELLAKVGI